MANNAEEIAALLKKLEEAGAVITKAPNPAQPPGAMSQEIMAQLQKPTPMFDAWVSWTKRF